MMRDAVCGKEFVMKCNTPIDTETKCALSGDELAKALKDPDSPRCEQELSDDDVFCPSCGRRVQTAQDEPTDAGQDKAKKDEVDYGALIMEKMPDDVRVRKPTLTFALAGLSVVYALIVLCAAGMDPSTQEYIGFGASFRPLTFGGQLWRMFTSTFLHFGFKHLAFNMLCLVSIGCFLEKLIGHAKLLQVYFLTAFVGGLFSMWFHPDSVCAGASGAVFGLFGATVSYVAFTWKRYDVEVGHVAGYMKNGLGFVAINFFYGLFPGIDMSAHIGGLVGGLVLGFLLAIPVRCENQRWGAWFHRGIDIVTVVLALIMAVSFVTGRNADGLDASDAKAQFNLGVAYYNGDGVAQDKAEAVRWFRKAAEQGHADAQFNLGLMYGKGEGVAQDKAEAVRWFRKAAEQGVAAAQYNLGVMHSKGDGVEQNKAEAAKWYRKAAEQGDAQAQNNLGVMYSKGEGVAQDKLESARWYRKAAEQGNAFAQYNLGVMYDNGDGVAQDKAEAVRWYRKAAEQGCAPAKKVLEKALERMNDNGKVQLWEGGPYWADRNIGASAPEDYGLYFWWGDTTGHRPSGTTFSSFSFNNCPTFNKSIGMLQSEGWIVSKDEIYVLAPAHDAAHVQWGGGWRMPTDSELSALDSNCDWTWTTQNGVDGFVVRGRGAYASNSIFLPAAGYGVGDSLCNAGLYGSYWSSVPFSDDIYDAWDLCFGWGSHYTSCSDRDSGQSVRPVQGFTK